MNVREFVKETIEQITKGVSDAQKSCKGIAHVGATRKVYKSEQPTGSSSHIEFDIAVVVSNSSESGGEASIAVWGIGIGGAKKKDSVTSTTGLSQVFAGPPGRRPHIF